MRARKRFGQHFLHDSGVIQRIVNAIAPQADECLIEIGPGTGVLTTRLLAFCPDLRVIEIDRDLIADLRQRFPQLDIIEGDVLKVDVAALRCPAEKKRRVVGNLPYNISTPLIFHLFQSLSHIQDMVFMLQKEVVERLAAQPGTADYGRLAVMAQYHCQVEQLFTVGPDAFKPPPEVDSAVVALTPHPRPPVDVENTENFAQLVQQAFSQRRKTLRNTLKPLLRVEQIEAAGVDPACRAETLTLADFAALTNAL
jgi:16S rRNA (adenine1518-N6/adenine1519-N6)-dimethyltransferase